MAQPQIPKLLPVSEQYLKAKDEAYAIAYIKMLFYPAMVSITRELAAKDERAKVRMRSSIKIRKSLKADPNNTKGERDYMTSSNEVGNVQRKSVNQKPATKKPRLPTKMVGKQKEETEDASKKKSSGKESGARVRWMI